MTRNRNVFVALGSRLTVRAISRALLICSSCAILAECTTMMATDDKSNQYQQGTYITANLAADGTTTNNITCGNGGIGGTVCSGGVNVNAVTIYKIKVDDGVWSLETDRQATDAAMRRVLNSEPVHFKKEKPNPLDFLKNGDRVLFRMERHKKIAGTEIDIFIPFADKPDKEAKFIASLASSTTPTQPIRPSDNVEAMCNAHRLSLNWKRSFAVLLVRRAME